MVAPISVNVDVSRSVIDISKLSLLTYSMRINYPAAIAILYRLRWKQDQGSAEAGAGL